MTEENSGQPKTIQDIAIEITLPEDDFEDDWDDDKKKKKINRGGIRGV